MAPPHLPPFFALSFSNDTHTSCFALPAPAKLLMPFASRLGRRHRRVPCLGHQLYGLVYRRDGVKAGTRYGLCWLWTAKCIFHSFPSFTLFSSGLCLLH